MGGSCSRPAADEGFADLHDCCDKQLKPGVKQATLVAQCQPQQQIAAHSSKHVLCSADSSTTGAAAWLPPKQLLDSVTGPDGRQRSAPAKPRARDLSSFILDNMGTSSSSCEPSCASRTLAQSFTSDSAGSSSSCASHSQLASQIKAAASKHGLTLEDVQAAVRTARAAAGGSAVEPFKRFDGFLHGPPKPACWDERHATAKAINALKQLRDGEIESVLRLLCHTFQVETATVALLTGECIYLTGACGALPPCICPDRWGFCGWSFLNPNHELVVVEDMEKDTRFSQNYFVLSPDFHLTFYCMAPLISSNNNRIGTLCIMGQQPRTFDAERGQLLANLAEMVVRQLERTWALRMCSALGASSNLMRSLACYDSAYLFVEVVQDVWRVMHMNPSAIDLLGAKWEASYDDLPKLAEGRHRQPFRGVPMQELFDMHHAGEEWLPGKWEFTLRSVCGAAGSSMQDVPYDLHFRLSTSDGLDADQPFFVGVPSWLPEADDGFGSTSFFVRIEHAAPRASLDRPRSMDAARASERPKSLDGPRASLDRARPSPPHTPPCGAGQPRRNGSSARGSAPASSGAGASGGSSGSNGSGACSKSRRSMGGSSQRGSLESLAEALPSIDGKATTTDAPVPPQPAATAAERAPAAAAPARAHVDHVKHVRAIAAPSSPKHSQPQLRGPRTAATGFSALTLTDTTAADAHAAAAALAPGADAARAAAAQSPPPPAAAKAALSPRNRGVSKSLELHRHRSRDDGDGLQLARQGSAPLTPGTSQPGTPGRAMPAMQALAKYGGTGAIATTGRVPWAPRGVASAPIEGLLLGPLMGKGSFGRVYRGIYKGAPCAVKIVDNVASVRRNAAGEPLEAALTCGLHHLGLMRTLKYAYADAATDAYSSPAVKTGKTCWMVFEHCNKGCVADAVVKGWFRTSCKSTEGGCNLRTVVLTAYEVASAMLYLHSQGVTHGDLCGGNVMLHESSINASGFTCKVGDFGMAREASANLLSRPNAYGTITHMPPEVLLDAKVSPAMDVYAFGVLFWEMLTSSRAWAGLRHAQIVMQAAVMKRQLEPPPGLPAPLLQLLQSCLAHDAADRCTFKQAVAVLGDFLQAHAHMDAGAMELPLHSTEPSAAQ